MHSGEKSNKCNKCDFASSYASALKRMHNHTGCICLTFLHRVSSNVSSNCLPERMHNHTGCICLSFLHCVPSNVSSNYPPERIHNHTGCICLTFLQCVFSYGLEENSGQCM